MATACLAISSAMKRVSRAHEQARGTVHDQRERQRLRDGLERVGEELERQQHAPEDHRRTRE